MPPPTQYPGQAGALKADIGKGTVPWALVACELLRQEEGFRAAMYKCTAGAHTIGYGHNLDQMPISLAAAEVILHDDVVYFSRWLEHALTGFRDLSTNRKAALVCMLFQMGEEHFADFKRMIAAIAAQDWDKASREVLISKWAAQTPRRARLVSDLLRTG